MRSANWAPLFAEQGAVDFIEIGMAASHVLGSDEANAKAIRHLLVDEFQDTSRSQHQILAALLRGWSADAGAERPRTLFLRRRPDAIDLHVSPSRCRAFRPRARAWLRDRARMPGAEDAGTRDEFSFPRRPGETAQRHVRSHLSEDVKAGAAAVDFLPGVPGNSGEPRGAFEIHASFLQFQRRTAIKPPRIPPRRQRPPLASPRPRKF